ncbi:hypothetical protein AGMMS49587_19950 [Spirochaetia bacterium]|nr:hypothetical protein AGMMS49587_19950 [Spirochaetia bacterium]
MKRIVIFVILVFSAFGLIFAQSTTLRVQQSLSSRADFPAPAAQRFASGQSPQTSYRPGNNPTPPVTVYNAPPGPAKRIIDGILGVGRGMITLTDRNGVAWYILGLDRFVGFIDGLDLGEYVELEGYASPAPGSSQERLFQAVKLTLDNMDYDLVPFSEGDWGAASPGRNPVREHQVTVQPRREEPAPKPPKGWEHKHRSPWAPQPDPMWMMDLDMNAIWREDSKSLWDSSNFFGGDTFFNR